MSKDNDKTSLGNRLKGYEKEYETYIPYDNHIVIRLDGHKFSKFTKGFKRPFDEVLHNAMIETTKDLVKEFHAVTGYTQSDEITLVIPANYLEELKQTIFPSVNDGDLCINKETKERTNVTEEELYSDREDRTDVTYFGDDSYEEHIIYGRSNSYSEYDLKRFEEFNSKYEFYNIEEVDNRQIYGGRVQKISSLASAFTTMKFNHYIEDAIEKEMDKFDYTQSSDVLKVKEDYWQVLKKKVGKAWFDARVFGVESDEEAFNSVMWRVRDAHKNSRSMFAQTFCPHKELQGLCGLQQVAKALERGYDYEKMPECFKYGTLIKKQKYLKVTNIIDLEVMQLEDFIERTRIISLTKPMTTFSEDEVKFVMDKTIY